ncbi:MAG: hypothetical protein MUE41_01390 [Gemmatimonadaceae bacterium]|jgi:hypothetical protein|nr:hypothetical protein [Gemmatimonadaceae bacterium]
MSEFTDYLAIRSPDAATLRARLAGLGLAAVIFDEIVVPASSADREPWWAFIAADYGDLPPRSADIPSHALPPAAAGLGFPQDVFRILRRDGASVLNVREDEGGTAWSLTVERPDAPSVELSDERRDAATIASVALALGIPVAHIHEALDADDAPLPRLCTAAAIPYLPMVDRHIGTPAASLLATLGHAVLSSTFSS